MKSVMRLTEPNGEPVYIVKGNVCSWKRDDDNKKSHFTRIFMMNGIQIVKEGTEQVWVEYES